MLMLKVFTKFKCQNPYCLRNVCVYVCVCMLALSPKVSLENTEAINFMATLKKREENGFSVIKMHFRFNIWVSLIGFKFRSTQRNKHRM